MWKLIVALLLGSSVAEARQDAQAKQGFFSQKTVSFWRDESPARPTRPNAPTGPESIWAEPMRLPDGRFSTYVPPRPVLEFLENPTRENAQKYMDWQSERMEKIRKAAAMLSELQREKSAKAATPEMMAGAAVSLTYFKKAG